MKLDVKTIVTLFLTLIFGILVLLKIPIPPLFEEIFRLVIVFYFGTQFQKVQDKIEDLEHYKEDKENGKH